VHAPELVEEAPREREPAPPGARPHSGKWVALALSLVALAAAVVASHGPAVKTQATYKWPPSSIPSERPDALWYTPLILERHWPQTMSVTVPCALPRPLDRRSTLVLATARHPAGSGGLDIRRAGRRLEFTVGATRVASVPLTGRDSHGCAYRLSFDEGHWSLRGGAADVRRDGVLPSAPFVDGLFSSLELRDRDHPTVTVTTAADGSHPRRRQQVAWIVSGLTAALALFLAAGFARSPGLWRASRHLVRPGFRQIRSADAVVFVVLLGWLFLAPGLYDDGWIVAMLRNFGASGDFSTYYDPLGANLPLGYWLKWTQHELMFGSSSLVVLRLPALASLAATWVLCRWVLARVLAQRQSNSPLALWTLATTFVVGVVAWGMTLRPEPEVALLCTGVLACSVRFLDRPSAASLGLAGVLVSLSITAHPAGIAAVAPLILVLPSVLRWLRGHLIEGAAALASSAAALVTLAFIDSDIALRRADGQTIKKFGGIASSSWREELSRYASLDRATPIQCVSVALMLLAVGALLFRPRKHMLRADLPAAAVALGLVLFVATPSKWPSHFGSLLGLAAVAVATESARIGFDRGRSWGWRLAPLVVVGASALGAALAWKPRRAWNVFDLHTLQWTLGFEQNVPLRVLAAMLPILLLLTSIGFATAMGGSAWQNARYVASSTATALGLPAIVFTVGILGADAAKTDGWTLVRQNVKALKRSMSCGVADQARAPVLSSMQLVSRDPARQAGSLPVWMPSSPVADVPRFPLSVKGPTARSPWFSIRPRRAFGFFVTGTLDPHVVLRLEWVRRRRNRFVLLGTTGGEVRLPSEVRPDLHLWRFFPASEFGGSMPGANAIRVVIRTKDGQRRHLGVTSPVTYRDEALAHRLRADTGPVLVLPNLVVYMPCASLPTMSHGLVQVPSTIVSYSTFWPVGAGTSPFDGLADLYEFKRLPLVDRLRPDTDLRVYEVKRAIPGGRLLRVEKVTSEA
jgi:hypothetical protein